jgi:hypothetical protein
MKYLTISAVMLLILFINTDSSLAFSKFYSVFKKHYINNSTSKDYKDLITKTKCAICHDSNKIKASGSLDKKFRNPYGELLDELLSKDDKKNTEKIIISLDNISLEKSSESDKTYGELIENEELPYNASPAE